MTVDYEENDATMTAESESDPDHEFPCFRPKKRRKKELLPKITIRLRVHTTTTTMTPNSSGAPPHDSTTAASIPPTPTITLPHQFVNDMYTNPEQELEDTLEFFSNTHEDQDPAYPAILRQRAIAEQQQQLQSLSDKAQADRLEIEKVITTKYKEKHAATETELDKHAERLKHEREQHFRVIKHWYQKESTRIDTQVQNGIELYKRRHQESLNSNSSADRAHLQAKHRREIEEYRSRGEETKQKVEQEYKKKQEEVQKHFQVRLDKEEHNKKGARQKLIQHFRILQNRYLKQHAQRIAKERSAILATTVDPPIDSTTETLATSPSNNPSSQQPITVSSGASANNGDQTSLLKPTDPMISCPSWHRELDDATGGAARYNHRKGITSSLTRQLSIEMHNEGVWMSIVGTGSSSTDDKQQQQHQELIPWGTTKVAEVLDAIVCGEIPLRCEGLIELHPKANELSMAQGGQVRCTLFDFRTSEWTASQRRVVAMKDQEELAMKELDRKMAEFNKKANDAEMEVKRIGMRHKDELAAIQIAEETLNKVKMMQNEFMRKYQSMIASDGKAIPDLDQKKAIELNQRLENYHKKIKSCTQKVAITKRSHEDSKSKLQQYMAISKEAQKKSAIAANMLKKRQAVAAASAGSRNRGGRHSEAIETEKAATRIEDTIGALRRVAEHRRHQVEQMKLPHASRQWIQLFPNISGAMKKSIWHKLHRRKHYVVLRPSSEAMINEIRMTVTQKVAQRHPGLTSTEKHAIAESERLRAERLFLLATHPVAEEEMSAFPPKKALTEWGEPGWKLNLSVPGFDSDDAEDGCPFLPRRKSFPVFEQNLAEMMSSPGRQAAAFLGLHTTRCLSSPLSAFSIASSPAEEATVLPTTRLLVEGDAFNITEESLNLGYSFSMPPPRQAPSQSKKRSSSKIHVDSMHDASSSSKHSRSSVGASPSCLGKKPSSPRRSSSSKKTAGSGPSPKAQKTRLDPATAGMQLPQKPQLTLPPNQQQPPQQQQQHMQQQHHQQQQAHHNHMAHRNQQLMQQQAQMNHQQQQAAMHNLQRYPQAQQYSSSQMAQLRMMQQQAAAAAAGSPRHQLNPNFTFYNHLAGPAYPMAMQAGVRQQPNNPAVAMQHTRHPSSNPLQQQQQVHLQRQQQQQLVAGQQQQINMQQQQSNPSQQAKPPGSNQQQQM